MDVAAGDKTAEKWGAVEAASPERPRRGGSRLRALLVRLGVVLLARILGTADGHAVAAVASREILLTLRSRQWHRFLGMWSALCLAHWILPALYRGTTGNWQNPSGVLWCVAGGYSLQLAIAISMAQWSIRRLRRDLHTDRLDELMLTRCSPADIAMGEALASAIAALWLVAAAVPVCLFFSAMAGQGPMTALRLSLSLIPAGALGVWFGMGWGLAFTLRRPSAMVPLTKWWLMGPFLPILIAWSALGFLTLLWAMLSLVPGGRVVVEGILYALIALARHIAEHWNPLMVVGAAVGYWKSTWVTHWLALVLLTLFMMRQSMDTVQSSLAVLPERLASRAHHGDYWIHHDVHYFNQYFEGRRREPAYYDGGNPIAAFDVALGHRIYLHPFLWAVPIMAYLFMVGWSLLVPPLGKMTALAAVLIPATGALLLMSGGVAISFGWERDQHRWSALAVLPISDVRLAMGKIKGVVRPSLWVGFTAGLTSILLAWRGALDWEPALWMAIHVMIFPVVLASVSAVLALTTPTIEEAIYRWAVLGAIPTLAYFLPAPIGGEAGMALPFSPPLLALLLVVEGPTRDLVQSSWVSLGFEVFGTILALLILSFRLRRWTVGEKD
jgi:hypothetical protein